jgi:hypothetical protein
MGQKLITIAQYRDLPQAGLDKSILEAHGLACFLDNEFTVGVNWRSTWPSSARSHYTPRATRNRSRTWSAPTPSRHQAKDDKSCLGGKACGNLCQEPCGSVRFGAAGSLAASPRRKSRLR